MAGSKWKNKFNWEKIKGDIEKEKESKTKSFKDDRFFKPDWKQAITKQKFYTIRFLPDREGNPFAHYYNHAFKYSATDGSGTKWYINNCISTFGWDPKCPICAKNNEYYNSAYESDKEVGKKRARKQNWVSNIMVVNDPFDSENNGKVFLYRYGYRIYQKLEAQMFPSDIDLEDDDFVQFMPFDLFEGADFKLKIKDAKISKDLVPNYDDSAFSAPKAILKGVESKIDEIMEQVYDLAEFTDPKHFPTIEETIKQVGHLLGVTPVAEQEEEKDEDEVDGEPAQEEASSEADKEEDKEDDTPRKEVPEETSDDKETPTEGEDGELDDDEAFFANLSK